MSKQNNKTSSKDAPAKAKEGPKLLAESARYYVKKFGMYNYYLIRIDPKTQLESIAVTDNPFEVIMANLSVEAYKDLHPGHK